MNEKHINEKQEFIQEKKKDNKAFNVTMTIMRIVSFVLLFLTSLSFGVIFLFDLKLIDGFILGSFVWLLSFLLMIITRILDHKSNWGIVLMFAHIFFPLIMIIFILSLFIFGIHVFVQHCG